MIFIYIFFFIGQCFLIGKEVDHRLKIHFKVNSTIDRLLYRILLGQCLIIFIFGVIGFFSNEIQQFSYWLFWVGFGVFFIWPTRGRIIRETMAGEFKEFKFLDSFEKTLFFMILVMLFVSLPKV